MSRPILVVASLATLPQLCWAILTRKTVYILDCAADLPFLRGLWNRLIAILQRHGHVSPFWDYFPASDRYFVESWMPEYPNMFWDIEAEIERDLVPAGLEAQLPEYATAIHHAACNFAHHKLKQVSLLKRLAGRVVSIVGMEARVLKWFQAYFAEVPPIQVQSIATGGTVSAALASLAVLASCAAWIIGRLRLKPRVFAHVVLGSDGVRDDRHIDLLEDLGLHHGQMLLVFRNRTQERAAADWPRVRNYPAIHPDDVELRPGEALQGLRLVARDIWRLFRTCRAMPAELFFEVVKLPLWRLKFRTLIRRRPMRAFLAKDDYNSEHIIRTDELRRAGVLSLGISHGMPTPGIVDPAVRYLDFDVYYSFGSFPYPQHYLGRTWGPSVRLRPVGSFGLNRDHLKRLGHERSKDILFFISRLVGEDEMLKIAEGLARAFPDRRVIVKAKYRPGSVHHVDFSSRLPVVPNLIHSWDSSYDLMLQASYAVSNGASTVAAEAIQYGLCTWVWDSFPDETRFFYRHFPGLCIRSLEEIEQGIRDIEAGRAEYDRARFSELIDLSLRPISDVIRADLDEPALVSALNGADG